VRRSLEVARMVTRKNRGVVTVQLRSHQCQDRTDGMSRHTLSPLYCLLSKLTFTYTQFPVPSQETIICFLKLHVHIRYTVLYAMQFSNKEFLLLNLKNPNI